MKVLRLEASEAEGMRLDRFLAHRLKDYSRSQLQALIKEGRVTVDGTVRGADYRLRGEERVEVCLAHAPWGAEGFESWVLHEDKDLLVIDKPAGLLMHPLGTSWLSVPEAAMLCSDPNLAGMLQKARPSLAALPRCGIAHRLDRQTSGVLLVGKTGPALEALIASFKERRVEKVYRAVVRGQPEPKPRVEAPVGRKPGHRKVLVTPFGKPAETAFSVLERGRDAALVEARPLTGRTHQIRAHLALLGHPVAGDPEFDHPSPGRPWPVRTMLHAYQIKLAHPGTGRAASFRAVLPDDFRRFWKELKK